MFAFDQGARLTAPSKGCFAIGVLSTAAMTLLASCGGGGSPTSHARISECAGDAGQKSARVEVTNKGSETASYAVVVAFNSRSTGNQLYTGQAVIRSLAPGQKGSDRTFGQTFGSPVNCAIASVERVES